MARKTIDLVLAAVVLVGGMLALQAGRERARLAAHRQRLAAAAGELPVDDPNMVYVKALDTGDPLHFAWRIHLPAMATVETRSVIGHGWSGGSTWSASPTDFIARVRFRDDEQGVMNVYTRFANGSSRAGVGNSALARVLRESMRDLTIDQAGKSGVAVIDPKAKAPTVLLRIALPKSLQDTASPKLPAELVPNLFEWMFGPRGSLP